MKTAIKVISIVLLCFTMMFVGFAYGTSLGEEVAKSKRPKSTETRTVNINEQTGDVTIYTKLEFVINDGSDLVIKGGAEE